MDNYLTSQVFTIVIAGLLAFTFYVILATQVAISGSFTDLILIVNAVILIAIFAVVSKIERDVGKRRGKK